MYCFVLFFVLFPVLFFSFFLCFPTVLLLPLPALAPILLFSPLFFPSRIHDYDLCVFFIFLAIRDTNVILYIYLGFFCMAARELQNREECGGRDLVSRMPASVFLAPMCNISAHLPATYVVDIGPGGGGGGGEVCLSAIVMASVYTILPPHNLRPCHRTLSLVIHLIPPLHITCIPVLSPSAMKLWPSLFLDRLGSVLVGCAVANDRGATRRT